MLTAVLQSLLKWGMEASFMRSLFLKPILDIKFYGGLVIFPATKIKNGIKIAVINHPKISNTTSNDRNPGS